MEEFEFESAGAGRIHCRLWEPKAEPVAVFQIIHGVSEHMLRYEALAQYLNEFGIVVAGEDHMGHGLSVGENMTKGWFSGGWNAVAADSHRLQEILRERYPGLPVFLFGHSMGSFILRTILCCYPDDDIKAAIICGTGWQPKAVLVAGKIISAMDSAVHGSKHVSKLINSLAFGSYTKPFEPCKTRHDWICSDPEVVEKYEADPLCGFDVTSGLAYDMMTGLLMIESTKQLAKMNHNLPVWFIAGKLDPVGNMTQGVSRSAEAFKKAGMTRVDCSFFEGRHEIFNEPGKMLLYRDILAYIMKLM